MKLFSFMGDTRVLHEGKKIRDLLLAAEKRPADLARAAQVAQTSVSRWLKAERLGPGMWPKASRGLSKLGIDPWQVRSLEVNESARVARERPDEVRQMLHGFGRRQLEQLSKILDASPDTHFVLKVLIAERLAKGTE